MSAISRMLAVLFALVSFSSCGNRLPAAVRDLPKEVVSVRPINPTEWRLSNGLRVMFLADDELPVVGGTLIIPGGTLWEDPKAPGRYEMMADQMRQGGAGSRSPDVLDEDLEKLSASVSCSASEEFTRISFGALTTDFDTVFDMFADVVLSPRFAEERLSLAKGQALEGIRRRVDDPGTVMSIAFRQLLFGDGTPYGSVAVASDVEPRTRAELLEVYRRAIRPDGAVLLVAGKLDVAKLKAAAERRFRTWRPRGMPVPPAPAVTFTPKPGIYFVKAPFAQASIALGHHGPPRLTPDYPAIDVFNYIFGTGGFSSRLMGRVRTELGLAYGIYGAVSPGVVKGKTVVSAQTKAESADQSLIAIYRVLSGLQETPPGDDELASTKNSISNSFVFKFDSSGEALERKAMLELLKYPSDYDATYLPRIAAVRPEEVSKVARERWKPEDFVIVVVGNEKAYSRIEQLSRRTDAEVPEVLRKLPLYHARFDQKLILEK